MSKKWTPMEFVDHGALEEALQEATNTLNFSIDMREDAEKHLREQMEVVDTLEKMYDRKCEELSEAKEEGAAICMLGVIGLKMAEEELDKRDQQIQQLMGEVAALKWQVHDTKQATCADESIVSWTAQLHPRVVCVVALVEMESYELAADVARYSAIWLPDSPNKVEQVKSVRKQFRGMGLGQAMNFVEAYEEKYPYAG